MEIPHEEESIHLLKEPTECPSSELSKLAHALGTTCQEVFVRAYLRAGQSDSFGRAVFARYINDSTDQRILPELVRSCYAKLPTKKSNGNGHWQKRGFCSACMLNGDGIAGLAFAYSMIHPESVTQDVQTDREVAELPEIEKLYFGLLDSGALNHPDEEI